MATPAPAPAPAGLDVKARADNPAASADAAGALNAGPLASDAERKNDSEWIFWREEYPALPRPAAPAPAAGGYAPAAVAPAAAAAAAPVAPAAAEPVRFLGPVVPFIKIVIKPTKRHKTIDRIEVICPETLYTLPSSQRYTSYFSVCCHDNSAAQAFNANIGNKAQLSQYYRAREVYLNISRYSGNVPEASRSLVNYLKKEGCIPKDCLKDITILLTPDEYIKSTLEKVFTEHPVNAAAIDEIADLVKRIDQPEIKQLFFKILAEKKHIQSAIKLFKYYLENLETPPCSEFPANYDGFAEQLENCFQAGRSSDDYKKTIEDWIVTVRRKLEEIQGKIDFSKIVINLELKVQSNIDLGYEGKPECDDNFNKLLHQGLNCLLLLARLYDEIGNTGESVTFYKQICNLFDSSRACKIGAKFLFCNSPLYLECKSKIAMMLNTQADLILRVDRSDDADKKTQASLFAEGYSADEKARSDKGNSTQAKAAAHQLYQEAVEHSLDMDETDSHTFILRYSLYHNLMFGCPPLESLAPEGPLSAGEYQSHHSEAMVPRITRANLHLFFINGFRTVNDQCKTLETALSAQEKRLALLEEQNKMLMALLQRQMGDKPAEKPVAAAAALGPAASPAAVLHQFAGSGATASPAGAPVALANVPPSHK